MANGDACGSSGPLAFRACNLQFLGKFRRSHDLFNCEKTADHEHGRPWTPHGIAPGDEKPAASLRRRLIKARRQNSWSFIYRAHPCASFSMAGTVCFASIFYSA
jgi:hypothetical protein